MENNIIDLKIDHLDNYKGFNIVYPHMKCRYENFKLTLSCSRKLNNIIWDKQKYDNWIQCAGSDDEIENIECIWENDTVNVRQRVFFINLTDRQYAKWKLTNDEFTVIRL